MKHLKSFNESNLTLEQQLENLYGKDLMEEYTQLMGDIKDRCYDLIDLGFYVKIDWAYSTKEGALAPGNYRNTAMRDKTPKFEVFILGEDSLFDENYDEVVLPCIESIRALTREIGYPSGGGFAGNTFAENRTYVTYKIVIQKN